MGSTTVKLLLRATAPPSSQLFSLRKSAFPIAAVTNERFYGAKSRLEPLDVLRLAETARISHTPQQVEEFTSKIRQVVDWLGQLQAVDLHSVEPAIRADAMTAAVPTNEDSYIKVLKVLNKE